MIIRGGASEVSKGIHRFKQLSINPNGDLTCLKTVLQCLPPDSSCLYKMTLLQLVVATVKPPWGDLYYAAVTLR